MLRAWTWLFFSAITICSGQDRLGEIMTSPEKRSAFEGKMWQGAAASVQGKDARVKNFYFVDKFRSKEFRTGSYQGTKLSSYSDRKFKTRTAPTSAVRNIPKLDRPYQTKEITPRAAPEAGREVATRAMPGVREAQVRGTAQGALDRENAPQQALTIEQVREILNRSK